MKRRALGAAVTFAFATTILAQSGNPLPKEPPGQGVRKLSKRERKEKIAGLEIRFQEFLSDVEPILAPTELETFVALETDAQRDAFIEVFWHRHAQQQGTSSQVFRNAYYQRLEIAKAQFRRVASDRARLFLVHGPPSEVVRTQCTVLQPIEIWKYPQLPGVGDDARILLYRPRGASDFRIWNPIGGNMALAELVTDESLVTQRGDPQRQARRTFESSSPDGYINRIQLECREGDEILRAITMMVQSRIDLLKLFEVPEPNKEDTGRILRSLVIANPDAPKLTADFSVRYPAKEGSRTDVQMLLQVPRSEVSPAEVAGAEVYTIDVTGEVLKEGQLWEKYRYRFDFPGDFKGDKLPIVIDRLLRPASYTARVKVVDAHTGAEVIVEQPIDVPEIFTQAEEPKVEDAKPAVIAAAPPTTAPKKVEKPEEARLRIVPPDDEVVNGMQTIDTIVNGNAIKAVEFWLDGRKIAVRRAPPFSLDVDFGTVPQMRRIRAVALDAEDKPITGDDIALNTGSDPFRVRITSPRIAPHLTGPTRVEIDVGVPDGEELDAVELYWNETRVSTMFDPPFIQTVDIPSTQGVGYLRAVARLKDAETPPIEDVVLLNTPAYMEELNVHLVELPTTVTVNGKPSNHLKESAFKVFDEGKPVAIAKFEYVKNLPLSIGMAIDTSGSMQTRMDEAQKAGAQFFQNVMKKGDKAFLVAFDSEPLLVQKWSTKIADVHAGLAKLRAEEATALYDAVVQSLYNFLGVKGQKALVLITDGKDTASQFSFDQAIEYARRAAVPIYAIGIGIRGNEMDVRYKLNRFCTETGGSSFYIDHAADLENIYAKIQDELRSQYVIGFYPAPDIRAGSKWRELEVKVAEGKVKTIRGYYP